MGARVRPLFHGYFDGTDTRFIACLSGHDHGRVHGHRGHRRSHGLHRQDILGSNFGLAGQAQTASHHRIWPRGLYQAIFPLAGSVSWLIAARFIDRIGKGVRGAPRDALIADIAPAHLRGASFGLQQSLDTVGAFLGPLLAIALMWLTANNF